MTLHIKNMVCDRCLRTVRQVLTDAGLTVDALELGRVQVRTWPEGLSRHQLEQALEAEGFSLLNDPRLALVEQIKVLLISEVHHVPERPTRQNVSDYLKGSFAVWYGSGGP